MSWRLVLLVGDGGNGDRDLGSMVKAAWNWLSPQSKMAGDDSPLRSFFIDFIFEATQLKTRYNRLFFGEIYVITHRNISC